MTNTQSLIKLSALKRFLYFWYDCLFGFNLLFETGAKSGLLPINIICWFMQSCLEMTMVLTTLKHQYRLSAWKGKHGN